MRVNSGFARVNVSRTGLPGVVIRLNHGKGPAANFTVRRISGGIGIERIFPCIRR